MTSLYPNFSPIVRKQYSLSIKQNPFHVTSLICVYHFASSQSVNRGSCGLQIISHHKIVCVRCFHFQRCVFHLLHLAFANSSLIALFMLHSSFSIFAFSFVFGIGIQHMYTTPRNTKNATRENKKKRFQL